MEVVVQVVSSRSRLTFRLNGVRLRCNNLLNYVSETQLNEIESDFVTLRSQ